MNGTIEYIKYIVKLNVGNATLDPLDGEMWLFSLSSNELMRFSTEEKLFSLFMCT